MLGFATAIVRAFPISPNLTQIGVLKFSDSASVSFLLNRYSNMNDVIAAIRNLQIGFGNTNIAAALRVARSTLFSPRNGARPDLPNILILVTDGAANIDDQLTIPEADSAKAAGIEIFTVGITTHINEQQLRQIATTPSHFYFASDFAALGSVLQSLLDHSCTAAATVAPVATPRPGRSTSPVTLICYPVTFPSTTTTTTPSGTTSTSPSTTVFGQQRYSRVLEVS